MTRFFIVLISLCFSFTLNAQVIWYEDFSLPNGTSVDNGTTAWSTNLTWDCGGSVSGSFDVQGGQFVGNETDCEARWESEWIDVSAYTQILIYAVLDGAGSLDAGGGLPDTNKVGYRADGATVVTWLDEYAGAQVINSVSCGGSATNVDSIQIVVQMESTGGDEFHYLDDVTVTVAPEYPSGGGDTLFSRQDGQYDQTGTWSNTDGGPSCGCIPDSNSVVYITCGDRISLDSDEWVRELYVEYGGQLDWTANNVELNVSSNGHIEVSVGARIFENGRTSARIDFEGAGTHTLAVYSEDVGLEMDIVQVNNNCSLIVVGDGRIDIEDDFELNFDGATVINRFTNQLYIGDDLDMLSDNVVFHNDSGYLYIDGTLEILGENTELVNRDSVFVDLDMDGNNADNGQMTNYGFMEFTDDILMSNNSDNYRIDNFGTIYIYDDLRESPTGAQACEWHNRAGGYLYIGHNSSSITWEMWADYDSNTVDYYRAGSQEYIFTPQDAYWNLTLSGSGRKRTLGDLDINGSVLIAGTAIFDPDNGNDSLFVAKNWRVTSTNAAPFDYGTESVTFDGNTAQWINGDAGALFYDVIIDKPDSLKLLSEMSIMPNGEMTFSAGHVRSDSINRLIFNNNSLATGASNSSFVQGRVEKLGNDAFSFPIGDEGNFQPIGISAPANASDGFEAQYYFDDPRNKWNEASLDPSIHHVSTEEYWILNQSAGTPSASITLGWNGSSGGVTDLDSLIVARWGGALWVDEGNGGTTGNTTTGTIESNGAVVNFSPFTLGSTNGFSQNPLPIELLSFKAIRIGENVELKWTTASEEQNDYFIIERSIDMESWEEALQTNGAGNSNVNIEYLEIDFDAPRSAAYYRLKQVDYDGTFTMSNISYVPPLQFSELQEFSIQTFPNPIKAGNLLNIQLSNATSKELVVILRDIAGKEYLMKVIAISQAEQYEVIDISEQVPAGTYIVTATSGKDIQNSRVIIK